MKHSTFEKAAKAALCSLLLLSMAAQTDLTMAFGFGTADEDKVVTVYDGKTKKVVTTRSNSFKKVLSESEVTLNAYDKFWTSSSDVKMALWWWWKERCRSPLYPMAEPKPCIPLSRPCRAW